MPIRAPILAEIDRDTWLVCEYGLSCCYALLGEARGLIIDAGYGLMRLPAIAERLFGGRPYTVALTHGHAASSGGAAAHPGASLLHASDWPLAMRISDDDRNDARARMSPDFAPPAYCFEPQGSGFAPLHTGDAIELGGRTVTAVWTPGHTAGSCSFLDPARGIAFTGDACGRTLHCDGAVSDALTGLMRLRRAGGFDRLYPAHLPYTDLTALPLSVLDDAIGACRAALSPDAAQYACDGGHGEALPAALRYGGVELTFHPDRLFAEGEPHSPYPLGL